MKQYQLPSWFWPVVAGLLLGAVIDFLLLQFLMGSKMYEHQWSFFDTAMMPFWYPVLGLTLILSALADAMGSSNGAVIAEIFSIGGFVLLHLFHPVFWAVLFTCISKPQTRNIILQEVFLAVLYIALSVIGAFNVF